MTTAGPTATAITMAERWSPSMRAMQPNPHRARPVVSTLARAAGPLVGLALLALAAAGMARAAPAALRLQPAEVIDTQGFGKPLVALTMMVPAGWRTEGAVEWRQTLGCGRPVQRRLSARAPDGSAELALLPGEAWGATSAGALSTGCPVARFDTAQAYLQAWVQRHRPGARWLDYRPRPERSHAGQRMDMPGGGAMRSWFETGQALIAYRQAGREMRETLAVSVSFTQSTLQGLAGMPAMHTLFGESHGVLAWRAPEGRLDFRQFDAVWLTLRSGPEWLQRLNQGSNQMASDNAATQREIGRIQAQTSRETLAAQAQRGQMLARNRADIADIHNATQRHRDATNDRMHTQTIKAVREVEHYREPGGRTVELPSHYRQAWKLRDGSYVLTDDADFRPSRDLGVDGDKLERLP